MWLRNIPLRVLSLHMDRQQKKPRPLRMLFWESTWKCNLACRHCRRLDAPQNEIDELTTSEMCNVLDSVSTLGKPVIVFSGGEPLLRDDWEELSAYAKSLDLPTHCYLGATESKIVDAQAGLESGMSALIGALAGINMISGAGMLDFLACQSPEKLTIDAEFRIFCYSKDRTGKQS